MSIPSLRLECILWDKFSSQKFWCIQRQSRNDQRIRATRGLIVIYLPEVVVGHPSCLCGFSLLCFMARVPNHQTMPCTSFPCEWFYIMTFSKPFHGNTEVTISYRSEEDGGRLPVYICIFKDRENQSHMRLEVYNTHEYTAL